jgi:hypothetical protein
MDKSLRSPQTFLYHASRHTKKAQKWSDYVSAILTIVRFARSRKNFQLSDLESTYMSIVKSTRSSQNVFYIELAAYQAMSNTDLTCCLQI